MRHQLTETLDRVARQYPAPMISDQLRDIHRAAFQIGLALRKGGNASLCEIGGGHGFFALGCAAVGMDVTMVDDFNDPAHNELGIGPEVLYKELDVKLVKADVVKDRLNFAPESFDVFASFDSMEHWHHSPKILFHDVMRFLKPSGIFILGVPNCANLKKRISAPFGNCKWSSMDDWYESKIFRGHVREPDVDDLRYIGRDIGLQNIEIIGRNWLGICSRNALKKTLATWIDPALRLFPSLCSDLYLIGQKSL